MGALTLFREMESHSNIVNPMSTPAAEDPESRSLVGSDRVLALLRALADYSEGATLEELALSTGNAKSTVHRGLTALSRAGLAQREGRGRYLLGEDFLRLAFTYVERRPDNVRVQPILEALVERFGETAHYAVLDSESSASIVYRAKMDPPVGRLRLTSVIGGRNPSHATALGKLLLADRLPDLASVERWTRRHPLTSRTPYTLTSAKALHADFELIRERGYAIDDQESETGVACLALPVFLGASHRPTGAVSVSAISYRTPLSALVDAVDEMRSLTTPLTSGGHP